MRVFLSTTEAVHAVIEAVSRFGRYEIEPGQRIVYRQAYNNADVFQFMGVSEERVPWQIEVNLSTLRRGDLDNIRAALDRQLKTQAGSDRALEQTL